MKKSKVVFEESLSDVWTTELGVREVPLDGRPFYYVGIAIAALALVIGARVVYLNAAQGAFYAKRAAANLSQTQTVPAPRGIITDRNGVVLAENKPVSSVIFDVKEFLHRKDEQGAALTDAEKVMGVSQSDLMAQINDRNNSETYEPIVLLNDASQDKVVAVTALDSPILRIENTYIRRYPLGPKTAAVLGYVGAPTSKDLQKNPDLTGEDEVGKSGVEAMYDDALRGTPGSVVQVRDAKGRMVGEGRKTDAQPGKTLKLTIDAGLQTVLYDQLQQRLADLNRTSGAAVALDPQTGQVLAMVSFPSYDDNLFVQPGNNDQKRALLTSQSRPMFNRAIAGAYSPGSTIKPLEAVASLKLGNITPQTTVTSPGYFTIPNPYHPDQPTKIPDASVYDIGTMYLDKAIAVSSNYFFLSVGGGGGINNGIKGLGIDTLEQWWRNFGLGKITGIDLPGESAGYLPSPDKKQKAQGRPWVLGDTYNVSIGQGDLLVTPLQLINYISTIANGGKIYQPYLNADSNPKIVSRLDGLDAQFSQVHEAMQYTVQYEHGTTYSLSTLPFSIAAKTGTAQVLLNTQANALFVGFAPVDNPKIALTVLIENSREGSANTIPVAHEAFQWYWNNRINIASSTAQR